ncbi:MAG: LPXTG cell wall anchor domain-containing protein [Actinomycetota bacterium]
MRRTVALLLLCAVLVLAASAPAVAQARDPFRPPAGSAGGGGGVSQPPLSGDGDVTPPRSGGLPRTGQDVVMLIAIGFALMSAGGALRLTGRLLAI